MSRTAVWVAAMRAAECDRPDRWFDDQLAAAFVAAAGAGVGAAIMPGASELLAIRTRFYDETLLRACIDGIRQVVLLAAGLDSRAFRLNWPPGVRVFELDLPGLFAFKEEVLAEQDAVARCERLTVAADLRAAWGRDLVATGFNPAAPTAWLAEDLLPYLTMTDNDRLLGAIGGLSAAGSCLALDHMDGKPGPTFKSTVDDPVSWLAGHGWQASISRAPALGVSYGRPLPDSVDLAASNATIFCTATR